MFSKNIQWHSANFGDMWGTMSKAFLATTKTLISGIPLPLLILVGLIFLGMFIWQFLKDLKVV
jgi:hypothetical protein